MNTERTLLQNDAACGSSCAAFCSPASRSKHADDAENNSPSQGTCHQGRRHSTPKLHTSLPLAMRRHDIHHGAASCTSVCHTYDVGFRSLRRNLPEHVDEMAGAQRTNHRLLTALHGFNRKPTAYWSIIKNHLNFPYRL